MGIININWLTIRCKSKTGCFHSTETSFEYPQEAGVGGWGTVMVFMVRIGGETVGQGGWQMVEELGDTCSLTMSRIAPFVVKENSKSSTFPLAILPAVPVSLYCVWKPFTDALESGLSSCTLVSVKLKTLLSQYSLSLLAKAASLSILLASNLKFPIVMEGRYGLYVLFFHCLKLSSF